MSGQTRIRSIFQWVSRHPRWTATITALLIIGIIVGQNGNEEASGTGFADLTAQPAGTQSSSSPRMPNLVGMRLGEVKNSAPHGYTTQDLSPRGRGVWLTSNWTVAATVPAPGFPVSSTESVRLYYLRNDEYTWFQQHSTMPELPLGTPGDNIPQLEGIRELIDYRSVPTESTPSTETASQPTSTPSTQPASGATEKSADPSIEPASERASREVLAATTYTSTATVADSFPRPGEHVRTGRLITVVLKPTPQPTYTASADPPAGTYDSGSSGLNDNESHHVSGGYIPGHHCRRKWC
ncbi:hypothetical protein [Frankia sp. R82]|uniref:hypothetical protein n=1 Tax=Frankia sp. R82 TaxID=2950553 RepID=UPI00204470FA|nr:hypothetical protein [Frankia sp. R82]MCM3882705.1 hypothetical protein [Frankia sp. R82]